MGKKILFIFGLLFLGNVIWQIDKAWNASQHLREKNALSQSHKEVMTEIWRDVVSGDEKEILKIGWKIDAYLDKAGDSLGSDEKKLFEAVSSMMNKMERFRGEMGAGGDLKVEDLKNPQELKGVIEQMEKELVLGDGIIADIDSVKSAFPPRYLDQLESMDATKELVMVVVDYSREVKKSYQFLLDNQSSFDIKNGQMDWHSASAMDSFGALVQELEEKENRMLEMVKQYKQLTQKRREKRNTRIQKYIDRL